LSIRPSDTSFLGEKQWGVTYTPDSVCALEGSSVDLSCSYKHPGGLTVNKSFWFINEQHVDLREDDQYKGRVQYHQTQLYHTVRITDLRASDSQTYKFRFITDDPDGIYSIGSGVSLSVTDLTIEVLNSEQEDKRLICSSTCTLTNPTYIWYRNEQPVPEQNGDDLYLWDPTVDAGSYSCAVKEHEEIRSAAVSAGVGPLYFIKGAAAALIEGQTVTLTCSSMNIQPVSEQNRSVETLETGQNYSITSISSQHSGLYYCTALNQLGQHSSAPARLDVFCKYPPRPPSLSEFNGFNGSITLVCVSDSNPASSYTWFRKTGSSSEPFRSGSNLTLAAETGGVFYCLAENQYGSSNSSEWLFIAGVLQYDTLTVSLHYEKVFKLFYLQHATHSPNDTYSTLNPATRTSSEYDTLMVSLQCVCVCVCVCSVCNSFCDLCVLCSGCCSSPGAERSSRRGE
uniref:Ig-like domain-containing protein n=1 Tax=Astyanax mexicanus TaxID=7994 RepID=A0A3B1IYZ5_ASTMX